MFLFLICLFVLISVFVFLSIRFRNPYKLIMVFGKKGAGKTTFLAKTAFQYIRKGRPVYSTVYVPGAYLFDVSRIGFMSFPPNSVIFIDEVGMIWDNRNFKNFKTEVRDYFKLQRHYRHTVYLFSQTFDIDIKLRNLTDSMYLLRNFGGWLSFAHKISRKIVLVQPEGDSESRIADSLQFEPLLLSLFGARTVIFTFIPYWMKLFSSFDAPELSPTEAQYIPIPDNLKKRYRIKGDKHDKKRMVRYRIFKRHH